MVIDRSFGVEMMLVITGVIITDQEYPVRPAFSLLTKVLEEFSTAVPQTSYANPSSISFPQVGALHLVTTTVSIY